MKLKKSYLIIFICVISVLFRSQTTSAQQCSIIYATPNGASAGAAGTKTNPASILYALTLAGGGNTTIWLATGNYTVSNELDMISGVTLEGGFDPMTWTKSNGAASNINRNNLNPLPLPDRLVGVSCSNINNFRLQDLTINVADAPPGGVTDYGVYLNNCSNYFVVRCIIHAGKGSDGIHGGIGAAGVNGAPGANGQNGDEDGGCCTGGGLGGNSYPGSNPGGNGGDGGARGDIGSAPNGNSGNSGAGVGGGGGGIGGSGYCGLASFGCDAGPANTGTPGLNGINGTNSGTGANGTPLFAGGFFMPGTGSNGVAGLNGSGGGGGGGGSFGIFVFGNGTNGNILDCSSTSDTPGAGGIGGSPGGAGGIGGAGGLGGGPGCDIGTGGPGGTGGNGGTGGAGGNGSTGISLPYYEDGSGSPVNQANMNSQGEPIIIVDNLGCTWSDIIFTTTAAGQIDWFFDAGAIPMTASGSTATIQYSNQGRHTVTVSVNGIPFIFTDFVGIFKDGTPLIPNIISANSQICPGGSATFTSSLSALNYDWTMGGGSTPNTYSGPGFQTVNNAIFPNTGTYWITLQTTSACCGKSKIDSFLITILPILAPSVTIVPSNNPICDGDNVTFGATNVNGGNTPIYQWQINGVNTGPNSNTFSSSSLADGDIVTCIMTSSYQCPSPNPVTSNAITMSVHPRPALTCTGTGFYLGANTSLDVVVIPATAPPYNYNWDFGDGGLGNGNSTNHTYGSTGTYTAVVTVTDGFGCTATCTVVVNIVIPPIVTAIFSTNAIAGCGSVTASFTDLSTGNPTTWNWDFGDGGTDNIQNPTHTYTSPGVYTVTLIAGNGIYSDTAVQVNAVTVYPVPVAGFYTQYPSWCNPAWMQFFDSSSGATNWHWDFGDGSVGAHQNDGHLYTVPGTYTVTLIVGNDYGCFDTLVMPNYITIFPSPIADFKSNDTIVCPMQPVHFSDLSTGATIWSWDFGTGVGFVNHAQNPTYYYSQPGTYTITQMVENAGGCKDSKTITQMITVMANPVAYFIPDHDSLVLPDATVTFNNMSQNDTGSVWDFGNGTGSILDSPTITYTDSGIYVVTLTVMNSSGCDSTYSHEIHVYIPQTLFIPNSFTPDDDGLDDIFLAKGMGITSFYMKILDRWGENIFESHDLLVGWDGTYKGKIAQVGVFAYTIEVVWYTGRTFVKSGSVTLIRH